MIANRLGLRTVGGLVGAAILILAFALSAKPAEAARSDTLPLIWWSNTGARWTLAQARAALVSVPKIEVFEYNSNGHNAFYYLFAPLTITTLKGSGPSKGTGAKASWTRFEVSMSVDPLEGSWNPNFGPPAATFCMHANGRIKTTYPWTDFVLSGVREIGVNPPLTAILCKPTLANRRTLGRPYRG